MKKLICCILTLALILNLSGCSNNSKRGNNSSNTTPPQVIGSVNEDLSQESTSVTDVPHKSDITEDYEVKCEYLKNPDAIIAFADKSAAFWEKAYDTENGGFFTYVNRDGSVDQSRPYKIAFLQSRDAYGFTRAYQLTGKKEYLDYARKALDFLYENAWDETNGGWYQEMNADGSLAAEPFEGMNWNGVKWSFNQFYVLCGISAMYDATRDNNEETWLNKSYLAMDNLWDSREGYEGYYDRTAADWSNPNGKSSSTTMDAVTTHASLMALLDESKKERLLILADNLADYLVGSMDNRTFGAIENFDSDWNELAPRPETTSGNMLKPAWCLAMAYLIEPRPEYKEGMEKLIDQIIGGDAYDNINGGCFTNIDHETGKPTDNIKTWWILEQAVTSGLTGYYITRNTNYLEMADESLDFYMKYMYDAQYGDVYGNVNGDGTNPDDIKGQYWKGVYHSIELDYYTYLYGNLMLNNKPVTLYYYFEPNEKARELQLNPVSLGEKKLIITDVTLNGEDFKDYDAAERILSLQADTGGEFKVTFEPSKE